MQYQHLYYFIQKAGAVGDYSDERIKIVQCRKQSLYLQELV